MWFEGQYRPRSQFLRYGKSAVTQINQNRVFQRFLSDSL